MAEAGVPDYEFTGWHGIAVRAGTPPAVIDKLAYVDRLVRQAIRPG